MVGGGPFYRTPPWLCDVYISEFKLPPGFNRVVHFFSESGRVICQYKAIEKAVTKTCRSLRCSFF